MNTLPKAAQDLVDHAKSNGWTTLVHWDESSGGAPFVTVHVGRKLEGQRCWYYQITWHSHDTGTLRLSSKIQRTPDHFPWSDAPSLKAIRRTIGDNPETYAMTTTI